ncbi:hypothetical protein QBC32DRAFT_337965 [Pseudoneurospora amorphoporcata]|uniref:Uncharacterized protein n=1 Tax=Pseudoneurospora amorphoporcata TaxID=241081 RepID=A0AAN6SI29_9PEZI|nr:hypothetical protein QBC32DRAFT_337965 [Pseudoneurospora amorphoporcata]
MLEKAVPRNGVSACFTRTSCSSHYNNVNKTTPVISQNSLQSVNDHQPTQRKDCYIPTTPHLRRRAAPRRSSSALSSESSSPLNSESYQADNSKISAINQSVYFAWHCRVLASYFSPSMSPASAPPPHTADGFALLGSCLWTYGRIGSSVDATEVWMESLRATSVRRWVGGWLGGETISSIHNSQLLSCRQPTNDERRCLLGSSFIRLTEVLTKFHRVMLESGLLR